MSDFDDFAVEHGPRSGETILFIHGNSIAGWMWTPQIELLPDRHILAPDLPGLGARRDLLWPGLPAAADDIADTIRSLAIGGRAHVVGLSLGGFVAVHLLRRHPELVRSCLVSGVALAGLGRVERALIAAQLPLWHRRWYWALQAAVFRIPADSRRAFADAGSGVQPDSNRRTFAEIADGAVPTGPFAYDGPVLAVAGEREPASIRAGFTPLRAALPQTRTWIAPRMHHPWSIEDPELFTDVVVAAIDGRSLPRGAR